MVSEAVVLTSPEQLVFEWLTKHKIEFEWQVAVGGGRTALGGSIGDFIITEVRPPLFLRVQGTYWHAKREARAADMVQKEQLEQIGYTVVDIWERRIMENTNIVMEAAMAGIELGE